MSSGNPADGSQSTPSPLSPPVQPSPKKSSTLKLVVIAVVAIIVVAAVVVAVTLPNTTHIQPPAPQPTFTFLSASNLTSVYGLAMTSTNETKNLSSYIPNDISYTEIVKAEMWLYQPFETGPLINESSLLVVGTVIMYLNSSRIVNQSLANFIQSMSAQSNVTIGRGNMSGFRYVSASETVNGIPADIYFAVHGRYILFVEFIGGSAVAKAPVIFSHQVNAMVQPAKA